MNMMSVAVIGIDPGIHGGIAALGCDGVGKPIVPIMGEPLRIKDGYIDSGHISEFMVLHSPIAAVYVEIAILKKFNQGNLTRGVNYGMVLSPVIQHGISPS